MVHITGNYIGGHGDLLKRASLQMKLVQVKFLHQESDKCLITANFISEQVKEALEDADCSVSAVKKATMTVNRKRKRALEPLINTDIDNDDADDEDELDTEHLSSDEGSIEIISPMAGARSRGKQQQQHKKVKT